MNRPAAHRSVLSSDTMRARVITIACWLIAVGCQALAAEDVARKQMLRAEEAAMQAAAEAERARRSQPDADAPTLSPPPRTPPR